jgi:hypothetical protein
MTKKHYLEGYVERKTRFGVELERKEVPKKYNGMSVHIFAEHFFFMQFVIMLQFMVLVCQLLQPAPWEVTVLQCAVLSSMWAYMRSQHKQKVLIAQVLREVVS